MLDTITNTLQAATTIVIGKNKYSVNSHFILLE